jgi:hypothetical protein
MLRLFFTVSPPDGDLELQKTIPPVDGNGYEECRTRSARD